MSTSALEFAVDAVVHVEFLSTHPTCLLTSQLLTLLFFVSPPSSALLSLAKVESEDSQQVRLSKSNYRKELAPSFSLSLSREGGWIQRMCFCVRFLVLLLVWPNDGSQSPGKTRCLSVLGDRGSLVCRASYGPKKEKKASEVFS